MNTQELTNAVVTLLGPSFAAAESVVIHYGSRKVGRDIDLFVVQHSPAPSGFIEVGLLDLAVTSDFDFVRRLRLFDPAVTEPVLTGGLLCGDSERWRHYRATLDACRSTDASVAFLQSRANEQHRSARDILKVAMRAECTEYTTFALQSAGWCVSYSSFAAHYRNSATLACSFVDLAEKGKLLLPEFWAFFRRVRNGAEQASNDDVDLWLERIGGILA